MVLELGGVALTLFVSSALGLGIRTLGCHFYLSSPAELVLSVPRFAAHWASAIKMKIFFPPLDAMALVFPLPRFRCVCITGARLAPKLMLSLPGC